jgi:uncharacterized repeat protein (TIGR03803 family)
MKHSLLKLILALTIVTPTFAQNPTLIGLSTNPGSTPTPLSVFGYHLNTGVTDTLFYSDNSSVGAFQNGSLCYVNGILYGVGSGYSDSGNIFRVDPIHRTVTDLHDFGIPAEGYFPAYVTLTKATNGLLYGTTSYGGTYSKGTIFSYNISSNSVTDLYNFANTANGHVPKGSLLQASNGLLYGVTVFGACGVCNGDLFSYDINSATLTSVHQFTSSSEYYNTSADEYSLTQASNGLIYGMANSGGAHGHGAIFSFNPITNAYNVVYSFTGGNDGSAGYGGLMQASDGLLYGFGRHLFQLPPLL